MTYLSKTLTALLLLVTSYVSAQDTLVKYFDYNWKEIPKPAYNPCYMRMIMHNGKLWDVKDYYFTERTLQMYGSYLDDSLTVKQGTFLYYYPNGKLETKGRYDHGKKISLWRGYNKSGILTDSSYYVNGILSHVSYVGPKDDYSRIGIYDDSGKGIGYEWEYYDFKGRSLSSFGKFSDGYQKDSTWTYNYKNGKPSCIENYNAGTLIERKCFDTSGNIQTDNCDSIRIFPKFPGNLSKYLTVNTNFPRGYDFAHGDEGKIVCRFVIYEDGTVHDIEIVQSLHPAFDNEVKRVISKLPKWKPGMDHNRPVKVYYDFPFVFKLI